MQRRRILLRILLQAMVAGLLFVAIGNVRVPEEVTAAPAAPADQCANPKQPCDTTTSSVAVTTTTAAPGNGGGQGGGTTTTTTTTLPDGSTTTTTAAPGNGGGQGGGGQGGGTTTTTTTTLPDGSTTTTTAAPGNGGGQGNSGGGQGNPGGTTTTTTTTTTAPPVTTPPVDTAPANSAAPAVVETVPTSSTAPVVVEETTTTSSVPAVVETVPTTLAPPPTVRRSTTTTALPQLEPSDTTVPESDVNASSDLRIEGSDGGSYSVTVVYSLNEDGLPEAELRISDRMTKTAADLGFVTVRLVALAPVQDSLNQSTQITRVRFLVPLIDVGKTAPADGNKWDAVTNLKSTTFEQATEIRFGTLPVDGVVAMSADEVVWDAMPRLSSKSLATNQQFGYFVDSDGAVTVLTKTTGSFGLRQKREPLSIEQWSDKLTPGSATRLKIEGDIGEDPVKITVGDTGSVCQISNVGVLSAVSSGFCYLTAVQGGGSMYMSSVSETRVTEVSLVGQFSDVVVEYHTSIGMLLLVILLALFLAWQFIQTTQQIRIALRTDPSTL